MNDLVACFKIDSNDAVEKVKVLVQEGMKIQTACKKVADDYNKEYPPTLNCSTKIYIPANWQNIRKNYYRKIQEN